jgi:hypothetical protein
VAERSFAREVEDLKLGEGDIFPGEGILAITKALLQSGVSYVGGYLGSPISHLMEQNGHLARHDALARHRQLHFNRVQPTMWLIESFTGCLPYRKGRDGDASTVMHQSNRTRPLAHRGICCRSRSTITAWFCRRLHKIGQWQTGFRPSRPVAASATASTRARIDAISKSYT